MVFTCRMCGECCSTMGEIISIQEKIGEAEFRIIYTTTGEERVVRLDPDKQDHFFSSAPHTTMACPFLRKQDPFGCICTVHHSRPDICRQYSCFRILVLDARGIRAGRVLEGTRYFSATDPRLCEIWNTQCRMLNITEETLWEEEIQEILTRAGYHVVK